MVLLADFTDGQVFIDPATKEEVNIYDFQFKEVKPEIWIVFNRDVLRKPEEPLNTNKPWSLMNGVLLPGSIATKLGIATCGYPPSGKNEYVIGGRVIERAFNKDCKNIPNVCKPFIKDVKNSAVVTTGGANGYLALLDFIQWADLGFPPLFTQTDVNEYVKHNHPDVLTKESYESILNLIKSNDADNNKLGWELLGSFNLLKTPHIFQFIMNCTLFKCSTAEIEFYKYGIASVIGKEASCYKDNYVLLMSTLTDDTEFEVAKDTLTQFISNKLYCKKDAFKNMKVTLSFDGDQGYSRQIQIDHL